MPFHPDDADDLVRAERLRAAERVINRLPLRVGDEVEIVQALPPGLALREPSAIVLGYLPGAVAQVVVMASLASGREMEIPLLETGVRRIERSA